MLKGLVLTPPAVGRIAIGKVVERNGKRLPEKDDEFTITSQVQSREGWKLHPLDELLRKEAAERNLSKLRSIPVRLLFNDPDLNMRANYHCFDRQTGRPICVGNGETCKRVTVSGIEALPCPAPAGCDLGMEGNCKPYGRLNVRVDAAVTEQDELDTFVFRTTGFNSIRTLSARLRYFAALSGGLLAAMPLELRLRGKSTTLSRRSAIYYVDITVRSGMTLAQALTVARQTHADQQAAGMDQSALDEAARLGFACGEFEESEDEGAAVVEEFYPPSAALDEAGGNDLDDWGQGNDEEMDGNGRNGRSTGNGYAGGHSGGATGTHNGSSGYPMPAAPPSTRQALSERLAQRPPPEPRPVQRIQRRSAN